MYTCEDLLKKYDELREKIRNTEITDEVFAEIETEISKLAQNQRTVKDQIVTLVTEAENMCKLHKQVKDHANGLYTFLKRKMLTDKGVDLSKESNMYKYDLYLSHQITYGGFFKVELKNTMSR